MKKIAGKVTDIDFFSRKSTLPTCSIGIIVRILGMSEKPGSDENTIETFTCLEC